MALATRAATSSAAFKSWLSGERSDEVVLDVVDDRVVLDILDPLPDRHARHHAPVVFDGDRGELAAAIRSMVPALLRSALARAVAHETTAALNRARGRVD